MRHDVNDIFARCVDYNTKTYIDFFRFETINEYEYVTGDGKISVINEDIDGDEEMNKNTLVPAAVATYRVFFRLTDDIELLEQCAYVKQVPVAGIAFPIEGTAKASGGSNCYNFLPVF